jgi:Spy/CpxP family protein refolding chaperone
MVRFVVIFGFIVSFAAGLMVGMVSHSSPAEAGSSVVVSQPPATTRSFGGGKGVLPAALNLTPEQQEKMKKIWSSSPPHERGSSDPRNQAREERDAAILALLNPQEKAKYDEIQKNFQDRMTALDRDFRDDFQRKVQETDAILTPEQSVKYQEFLSRHQPFDRGPRDRPDRGFHESNRRGEDRATSQPRSQTQ